VVNGTSPKTVSNTNSNPESIPFLNALGVNGGKQVKTEWDGLGFNLSYKDPNTGKEFKINPTNYYAGREQGLPGLWNEVQDPSPTFKASYDQLAKNFPNINKVTESRGANGELITTTSLDSEKAYDNIRNGILNDKIIRNGINGDTMQFLSGSGYYDKGIGVTYDPENGDQENELMEAIANYTMAQYSKGKGEQVRDIRTQLPKTSKKEKLKTKVKKDYYDLVKTAAKPAFFDAPSTESGEGLIKVDKKFDKGKFKENLKIGLLKESPGVIVEGTDAVLKDWFKEDQINKNSIYIKLPDNNITKQPTGYKILDVDNISDDILMDREALNKWIINMLNTKSPI